MDRDQLRNRQGHLPGAFIRISRGVARKEKHGPKLALFRIHLVVLN